MITLVEWFIGMLAISGVWLLLVFNTCGEYNFNHVPNRWYHRILPVVAIVPLIWSWGIFFKAILDY